MCAPSSRVVCSSVAKRCAASLWEIVSSSGKAYRSRTLNSIKNLKPVGTSADAVPQPIDRRFDRYQGRFFQALGEGGREKACRGKYMTAIVSGLYGLVLPSEGIQLYSCPLDPEVAETWDRDSLLTDVLSDYIDRADVLRVIDLVAIRCIPKAY